MKTILKTLAVVLPFAVTSVNADTNDEVVLQFNGVTITQMQDGDLDDVTGTRKWKRGYGGQKCYFCSNNAHVGQANLSGLSALVLQSNGSGISQSNN